MSTRRADEARSLRCDDIEDVRTYYPEGPPIKWTYRAVVSIVNASARVFRGQMTARWSYYRLVWLASSY